MTAKTEAAAPTEAEIRELVESAFGSAGLTAAGRISDAFAGAYVLDALYEADDLRPSEQKALDEYTFDAMEPIRTRAIAELREAVVAAGLRFAAEYPDAPRAPRKAAPDPEPPPESIAAAAERLVRGKAVPA